MDHAVNQFHPLRDHVVVLDQEDDPRLSIWSKKGIKTGIFGSQSPCINWIEEAPVGEAENSSYINKLLL